MCLTLPARVLELREGVAVVDLDGRQMAASTALEPGTEVGDFVLVSAGTILRRLDPAEARFVEETIRSAEARATGG